MKISLLLTAIIISLAAFFGLRQKEKIRTLTTEWEELKATAVGKNISTDPKATFSSQRIRSESSRIAREKAINDFAAELAAFAKRMKAAQESGNTKQADMQKEVIGYLDKLTSMSSTDLKALVKALAADTSIKDQTKKELIMMSVMMMSSENPEAALAILSESSESLGLEGRNRHMLPMVLTQFATKDPAGAAAWLTENHEQLGDKAEEMKQLIITTAAQQNFASAMAIADTLELENPDQVFAFLAIGVKAGDQDNFMKSLKESSVTEAQRQAALITLANSPFIKEDFDAATTWLEGPALSAADKESFIGSLQFNTVRENPQKWLAWIATQDGHQDANTRANHQILEGWTQDNFVAAGEWVRSQEAGPAKNAAVETYAGTLAPHEPAAAAEWAETLPPGENRTKLFEEIHTSLKDKDPEAATAFADRHQLPE